MAYFIIFKSHFDIIFHLFSSEVNIFASFYRLVFKNKVCTSFLSSVHNHWRANLFQINVSNGMNIGKEEMPQHLIIENICLKRNSLRVTFHAFDSMSILTLNLKIHIFIFNFFNLSVFRVE